MGGTKNKENDYNKKSLSLELPNPQPDRIVGNLRFISSLEYLFEWGLQIA